MNQPILYDWSPAQMLEVSLPTPDSFLKIKETLTRIGISSKKEKKLYQSVHILHKQGRYFLVSFKELFALDGKFSNLTVEDVDRRNAIGILLEEWGLLKLIKTPKVDVEKMIAKIKIIPFKEKHEWVLEPKYNLGKKKGV